MKRTTVGLIARGLLLLCLLILPVAGCIGPHEAAPDLSDGALRLALTITPARAEVEELLRSGETDEALEIRTVDLFLFDATGTTLIGKEVGYQVGTPSTSITIEKKIPYDGVASSFRVAVVANGTSLTYPTDLTLSTLEALTVQGEIKTPLLMCGTAELTLSQDLSLKGEMKVKRLVSAIELLRSDGQPVSEIRLVGPLYSGASLKGAPTGRPAESTVTSTGSRFYIYPTKGEQLHIAFKTRDHAGIERWYAYSPRLEGKPVSFAANHLYQYKFVRVTADGYDTPEAAHAAGDRIRESLVYTIADRSDQGTSEVTIFGNYYLRIDQNSFLLDRQQMDRITYVYTNAPGLRLIPAALGTPTDSRQEEATWVSSALYPDDSFTGPGRRYTLNVGAFQYFALREGAERRAFGWIRATGIHTDDLQVQYTIKQVNTDRFHPDVVRLHASQEEFKIDESASRKLKVRITPNLEQVGWRLLSVTPCTTGAPFVSRIYVKDEKGREVNLWSEGRGYDAQELSDRRQQIGTHDIFIETKQMDNNTPDLATLTLYAGEIGGLIYDKQTIKIYRSFNLDYTITYPETKKIVFTNGSVGYSAPMPVDMRRDRYVIETPLGWDEQDSYTYTINVESNLLWRPDIEKTADGKEVGWVSLSTDAYSSSTVWFNKETHKGSFTVKVLPRSSRTTEVDHFYPAREAHISLRGFFKDKDSGRYEEVTRKDITVYQGGYVRIGDNYWLDRNLKSGYSYATGTTTDFRIKNPDEKPLGRGNSYRVSLYYGDESYVNIESTLYPYAIPVGHKTDVYGAYSRSNSYFAPTPNLDIALINQKYYPGNDGYFVSKAPTSGYAGGDKKSIKLYNFHSRLEGIDVTTRDNSNPCPPGWHVPTVEQLTSLVDLLDATYGAPTKEMNLPEGYSAVDGEMGERNSGRYLVTAPVNPSESTPIHWYLPAAGYRSFNYTDIRTMGTTGAYKTYELLNPWAESNIRSKLLYFTPSNVWMHTESWTFCSSIRCVKKVSEE